MTTDRAKGTRSAPVCLHGVSPRCEVRRLARVAVRCIAFVVLVAIGCELAARLVVGGEVATRERAEFLDRLPGQGGGDERADEAPSFQYRAYGAGLRLHPFFGYTFAYGASGANNHGFFSGAGDFPYEKRPHEYVIGVFGGSVGMQACEGRRWLIDGLRPALNAKAYREATVLCFAVGAWRQPQSFIALVHYLPMIDLAIQLDGFNEVVQTSDAQLRTYPASFPWSDVYGQMVRQAASADETLRVAELVRAHRGAARFTRMVSASPLRHSRLAHLVWRACAARYRDHVVALRAQARDAIRDDWSGIEPVADEAALPVKRDAYLDYYVRLVRSADLLARAEGKPYFHFLQPNQYLRGSKPLSDEERRERITNQEWFDVVTGPYRHLSEASRALYSSGVQSHTLALLFRDTAETVYSDDCCHLNARGVEIMTRAMAETIMRSGGLDRLPPSAPATLPASRTRRTGGAALARRLHELARAVEGARRSPQLGEQGAAQGDPAGQRPRVPGTERERRFDHDLERLHQVRPVRRDHAQCLGALGAHRDHG